MLTETLSLIQQLNVVTPLQLLYHPKYVMKGEVSAILNLLKLNEVIIPLSGVAFAYLLLVFRAHWIYVPVQHDFLVSLLSQTRRDKLRG